MALNNVNNLGMQLVLNQLDHQSKIRFSKTSQKHWLKVMENKLKQSQNDLEKLEKSSNNQLRNWGYLNNSYQNWNVNNRRDNIINEQQKTTKAIQKRLNTQRKS